MLNEEIESGNSTTIIKRIEAHELIFPVSYIFITIGVLLLQYENGDMGNLIGLAFIFGIPALLIIFATTRRHFKYPFEIEIKDDYLILTYRKRKRNISISLIMEINVKISSQRTATFEIKFYPNEVGLTKLVFTKKEWDKSEEFFYKLSLLIGNSSKFNILLLDKLLVKRLEKTSINFDWHEYFTAKKTIKNVFQDIIEESIIKKGIILIGFLVLLTLNIITGEGTIDFKIYVWLILPMGSIYLLSSFIYRLKGYSREDAIENFFSNIVCLMMVLAGVYGYINTIYLLVKLIFM